MQKIIRLFSAALVLYFPAVGQAASLTASITPGGALEAGKPVTLTLVLKHAGTGVPVLPKDIKIAHTKRVHLLVVDPTLGDYQHLHPVAGKDGIWRVSFTPRREGSYRVWVDVVPVGGTEEYLKVDLGKPAASAPAVDRTLNTHASVDGYDFSLAFEQPLKAGQMVMGSVTVSRNGKPVTALEPVMGAFAHIVAFGEDGNTVLHVHPMGAEPTKAVQRGGPKLDFHLMPAASGFVKLFVQTKIHGREIFAPFGLMVAE